MNLNYDLATWIKYFIGAFACCFSAFLCGKQLLNKPLKEIKTYNILIIILFSIFLLCNSLLFDNIMKLFGTLIVFFCIYKYSLNCKLKESIIYSIFTCVVYLIGEITFIVSVSILDYILKTEIASGIVKSCYGNIVIGVLSVIYSILLKKFIISYVKKVDKSDAFYFFILGIIAIFMVVSSVYKLYLNHWIFNYLFVLNLIIIIGCISLFWILLKQYIKNKEINNKYLLLKDYLKTSAELIEKYSTTVHKYKNNLIAIKGYLKTDNKKANTYIDSLLESYDYKKYSWFNKINYIKLDGFRYLVYYKLSKAENNNLKITVDVSAEIKKYDNNSLSVYDSNILLDIVGELFDNAIYASNASKEKELNVINYEDKNEIVFILSNTYKGQIDLSLITKNGYTTKGEGHGIGLYDIDKTIKKYNLFNIKYEIVDNYFLATLKVKIK